MATHARFYGFVGGFRSYFVALDIIRNNSFVVLTACEGSPAANVTQPDRFVGVAKFLLYNVAPQDGGVWFRLDIGHEVFFPFPSGPGGHLVFTPWPTPLHTYLDITVF